MRCLKFIISRLALLLLLFLAWARLFRADVVLPPQFTVFTGATRVENPVQTSDWSTLQCVSDDGKRVVVGVHHMMNRRSHDTKLEIWDTRTGANVTPQWWNDLQCGRLLHPYSRQRDALQTHQRGIWGVESAWNELRNRRPNAIKDYRSSISPDGQLFAYFVWKNGGCGDERELVDPEFFGTIIEEVRTGKQVAMLPYVMSPIIIASDNRTAVSNIYEEYKKQRGLLLWNLETGRLRAELSVGACEFPPAPAFSDDGKYLFAKHGTEVTWWDAATGRQIGHIAGSGDCAVRDHGWVGGAGSFSLSPGSQGNMAVIDGGGTLVTEMAQCFSFWDLAAGTRLDEWNLGEQGFGKDSIQTFVGSESGRYLIAEKINYNNRSSENVLLWDLAARREVGRFPGESGALSANGRWLATIDTAGAVRVWEVSAIIGPRSRETVFKYAALMTLFCSAMWLVLNKLWLVLNKLWTRVRVPAFKAIIEVSWVQRQHSCSAATGEWIAPK